MTGTAQPASAAETAPSNYAPENAALDDGAQAFKVALGQVEEKPRDDRGRFAASAEEEEIETDEAAPAEPVESDEETDEADEAAEEAQPEAVDLPASWSKDDAELWSSLPAEAKAKIADREAQRDAAVNAKFQEAANVRRVNEAIVTEANANRAKYVEAADTVLSLIQPQRPNPNEYFTDQGFDQASFSQAQYLFEQQNQIVTELAQQRQQVAAQQAHEADEMERQAIAEIERVARPAFLADVPDVADPQKSPQTLNEIIAYAVQSGIPQDAFTDPESAKSITSAQLHLVWKAMQYDKRRAAQVKVNATPKPEPKKPQPVVKPGMAAPRAAKEQARLSGAFDRLAKTGSVEDGAAIFKQLLKGSK